MATNEKPSDEDFETARRYVAPGLHQPSVREGKRARAVLRYLLAEHDAKPATLAVPEDVVRTARETMECPKVLYSRRILARFVLSLVPAPEPEFAWRDGTTPDRNTEWILHVGGAIRATLTHTMYLDEPMWRITVDGQDEWSRKLDSAKARAEELCGVSTKKGG